MRYPWKFEFSLSAESPALCLCLRCLLDHHRHARTAVQTVVKAAAFNEEAPQPAQSQRHQAFFGRRDLCSLTTTGSLFGAHLIESFVNASPAKAAGDFILFEGGSGKLSPISCTRPKDPSRAAPRGSSITAPKNFEFVDPCPLGGYTLDTPWSFWGPTSLQPLTGFKVGAFVAPRVYVSHLVFVDNAVA
ncbi:hypothetical protein CYMTET_26521 [Cymbomonas tetramitiformis]|uniref:Uncharacterized protein n=1 Tax=Cymbomonas tetramitiformis TaxID=36881 RepID=A0AAE0FSB3_9CHLO|nr:hypothetical protein CYMTET_26521 [Cymbomonas tetramitiformis]